MHIDARTLDEGTLIEGDVCIIGAGAAGISMALDWVGSPYKVVLLEGGGFDVEAQMQELYRGDNVGLPYFPLQSARLHFFGGTTGHWAGWCSPLDPIDFKERDWVSHSGWPISFEDVEPFYPRAQPLLEIGPYEYGAAYWEGLDPDVIRMPADEDVVWTKMWQFSPPTRFGTVYRDPIVNAPNVHLYTYANATEIEANDNITAVEGLRVKTIDGKEHRVKARYYVVCGGAIENARLLLASDRKAPAGLGNDHDQVGRYFMEHIEITAAQLMLEQPEPMKMYGMSFGVTKARGELALSEEAQREHRILNGTASLRPGVVSEDMEGFMQTFSADAVANVRARNSNRSRRSESSGPPPTPSPERAFQLFTRQEQEPNPDSRISLIAERDELDMRRVQLNWLLTPLDKRSIRVFYELLGQELGRAGVGRVQLMEWLRDDDTTWPDFISGGWHHMGTTRMHEDPRQGVVDADCKVHGLANLYVAGSSVYTTGGAANPTLTLVALALRLSDHLKGQIA